MDYGSRFCIIGAGPCGLTAAKTLRQSGIAVDVLERGDDLGGNWRYGAPGSSVYASTAMISSKRMTQFSDFPMPKSYSPYPSHRQALEYLRSYAEHFGLRESIEFGATVARVEPLDAANAATGWRLTLAGGSQRDYRGVVVASGHHSEPRWPELAGEFSGRLLHAHDYKTPDVLTGKRVLVVGGGNSGCDIAVESSRHAATTLLSLRRGYHFLPKFLLGGPLDAGGERFERWHVPRFLRQWITRLLVHVAHGSPERYGLPRPMHRLFETHPIVNSQLLYSVGHGAITVRPAIKKIEGHRVSFTDGKQDEVDVIVCATGYKTTFPFLDRSLVLDAYGRPRLFANAFHPQYDNLFFAGLLQPNGAIWPLAELQAQLIAAFIKAQQSAPKQVEWFRRQKNVGGIDAGGGIHYDSSARHMLEVEFHAYRKALRKLLTKMAKPQ